MEGTPASLEQGVTLHTLLHEMAACAERAARETLACCGGWRADRSVPRTVVTERCGALELQVHAILRQSDAEVLERMDAFTLTTDLRCLVDAMAAASDQLSRAPTEPAPAGAAGLADLLHAGCVQLAAIMAQLASGVLVHATPLHDVHARVETLAGQRKKELENEELDSRHRAAKQQIIEQLRVAGSLLNRVATTLDGTAERQMGTTLQWTVSGRKTRGPLPS